MGMKTTGPAGYGGICSIGTSKSFEAVIIGIIKSLP